jgi:hypothetical protein
MLRPSRALLHPLWLSALVVLVVNDHVAKGAGLVPELVTGKASDFAGLLVAQVVLAVLVRARSRRGLARVSLVLGVVFAAIKTSPWASALYERLLAFAHATNMVDPTDLVALLVLPVGYVVFGRAMHEPEGREPASRRVAEALALVTAVPFCLATSAPPVVCADEAAAASGCVQGFDSPSFVFNPGTTTVTVRVRTLRSPLASTAVSVGSLPCDLSIDAFSEPSLVTLAPGEAAPLGTTASPDGVHVALVSADDDLPAVLLYARSPRSQRVPSSGWTDGASTGGSSGFSGGIGVVRYPTDGLVYRALGSTLVPFTCDRDRPDASTAPDASAESPPDAASDAMLDSGPSVDASDDADAGDGS